jgi:hypothetical protein
MEGRVRWTSSMTSVAILSVAQLRRLYVSRKLFESLNHCHRCGASHEFLAHRRKPGFRRLLCRQGLNRYEYYLALSEFDGETPF